MPSATWDGEKSFADKHFNIVFISNKHWLEINTFRLHLPPPAIHSSPFQMLIMSNSCSRVEVFPRKILKFLWSFADGGSGAFFCSRRALLETFRTKVFKFNFQELFNVVINWKYFRCSTWKVRSFETALVGFTHQPNTKHVEAASFIRSHVNSSVISAGHKYLLC